jgi:hypothetical protein
MPRYAKPSRAICGPAAPVSADVNCGSSAANSNSALGLLIATTNSVAAIGRPPRAGAGVAGVRGACAERRSVVTPSQAR